MTSLNTKTAVVTGASSGIGLATTVALLSEGVRVVMVDRDESVMQEMKAKHPGQIVPYKCDLLNGNDCAGMVNGILAKVEKIDIFHANAGCYLGGDITESEDRDIERLMDLNVTTVMKNIKSVLPHMIDNNSGDIIVTSSIAGHFPVHGEPVYSASKWAIHSFVQCIRRQVLKKGIRVGSVSPGPVISALLSDWPEEKLKEAHEAGSLMQPADVAETIIFMLTRPRGVTIRDVVIQPSTHDL